MKKAAIIIVLALAVSFCLFALTGNYEFKYKLTRTTTMGVSWIFTDSGSRNNLVGFLITKRWFLLYNFCHHNKKTYGKEPPHGPVYQNTTVFATF